MQFPTLRRETWRRRAALRCTAAAGVGAQVGKHARLVARRQRAAAIDFYFRA